MRIEQMVKLGLTILGLVAFFGIKVHAASLNVNVKKQAEPPKYLVDGKEVNAAEATIAVLQGRTAMKCQQMEVEAGRNGLSLKAKKSE